MKWTIEEALPLAKKIEPIAVKNNCHIAIGGSVLYVGESENDLDFLVYPHSGKGLKTNYLDFLVALAEIGFSGLDTCSGYEGDGEVHEKEVWNYFFDNKLVNFICLNRWPNPK